MSKHRTGIRKAEPYCYITPIALILIVFVIGSVIISIVLGFTKYNIMGEPIFRGVENYTKLMTDSKFMKALKNTIKLMVMIVPFQTLLSIVTATFLVANRNRFLGRLANSIIFIPVLCSNAVVGVVWRELLNGKLPLIEKFFGLFGIQPSMLLGDAKTALTVVAMVAVWKTLGYYVVIYSSGLLGISETFYEAAKVDGAGKVKSFFMITLPMLKPTIILGIFLSITSSLQCFDLIFTLTGGGPNNASTTLVVYAYSKCFSSGAAGYAMAISNVLFVVILAVALLQQRMMRREASEI
ncbi:MAG: carbohydrate ABC transporter permease [Lachnospiraceae bacterium]